MPVLNHPCVMPPILHGPIRLEENFQLSKRKFINIVLKAQLEAIQAIKPGKPFVGGAYDLPPGLLQRA